MQGNNAALHDSTVAVRPQLRLSKADLINQPSGQQVEYRVLAVNKAGEGMPSNTVAAVV